MSNVLIGIIGVILFIGLALAGALFLGPRFQEATNESKASATVQAVSQIAHAVEMRNATGGQATSAAANVIDQLAAEGWLKAVPANPSGGSPLFIHDRNASNAGAAYIVAAMLPYSKSSKPICDAVAKHVGKEPFNAYVTMPTGSIGCAYSSNDDQYYLVYATIQ